MKRKEIENADSESKIKKSKKSIKNPNDEPQKLKTKSNFKKSEKIQKRGKFEKPVVGKKSDKPNKAFKKVSETNDKANVVAKKFNKVSANDTQSTEKPDWVEFKKSKKELREQRKSKKLSEVYDVSIKVKKIGEKLRKVNLPTEEREKLTMKLHGLLKGQYNKMIFTHDISRVIQWLLKYGNEEIRSAAITELKPSLVLMLTAKYARNCVKIALKYGTDQIRRDIISACYGHIVKLASHSLSAPILELAFSSWATNLDKIRYKQEFYGDMYKHAKDDKITSLTDVFKTAEDMKPATLTAVKGNLIRILNKKLVNSTLVQTIICEFLSNCTPEDRSELIAMLRSLVVELSRTKDGAKVATMCVWHGTTKDRKNIMKALKGEVANVAKSEHGYMILLALFDCVDDTVLMKKMLLPEILEDLKEIATNEFGKRVVLYLVARRDPHYFHPQDVEQLKQGDDNSTSKKPADIREQELREGVMDNFLESVATDSTTWLSSSSIAMVTLAILKASHGRNAKRAFDAIAKFIVNSESKITEAEVEYEAIEHSGLHMMFKKLIQNDKNIAEKDSITFSEVLVDHLSVEVIKKWIAFNRGCFLLITLIECGRESTVSSLLSKLKPVASNLKSKKSPGASILLKKIK